MSINKKTNGTVVKNEKSNLKVKEVKTMPDEQEAKRSELIKMSERIKTQYREISKLENSINTNTYEIGKTLINICSHQSAYC